MNKADRAHLSLVAQLGCIVCRNQGYGESPAEIHHIRSGMGLAKRAEHTDSIPLCPGHHRTGGYGVAFHAGKKAWEAKFGTERELLEQTKREVNELKEQCVL